jgi:hypothetical protein
MRVAPSSSRSSWMCQLREASVMLERRSGAPCLSVEWTGSNARAAHTTFKRLPEHDLARLRLRAPQPLAESEPPVVERRARSVDPAKLEARLREKLLSVGSRQAGAVAAARRLPSSGAAAIVSEAMTAPSWRVRRRACDIAGAAGLAECAEAALELLEDPHDLTRSAAADFLRSVRCDAALPRVARRMLEDRRDFLTGARTLRNWGEKAGNEALKAQLRSDDTDVRAAACLATVQYGGKALVPELVQHARNDLPLVAAAALHALEAVDPARFAEAHAHALTRDEAEVIATHRASWRDYRRI